VGNERRHTLIEALPAKPSCAIERVKAGGRNLRGVPDVVKPGRRHEDGSVRAVENRRHPRGLLSDRLDVRPPPGQLVGQVACRDPATVVHQRGHSREPTCPDMSSRRPRISRPRNTGGGVEV
jgi:hypothetical protein